MRIYTRLSKNTLVRNSLRPYIAVFGGRLGLARPDGGLVCSGASSFNGSARPESHLTRIQAIANSARQ